MTKNGIESETNVSAAAAVNEILRHEITRNKVTNLHLNKILYFTHGFLLAISNQPLISREFGECIKAWKFGPVIPSIYHEFKRFKDRYIEADAYSCLSMETETCGTKYFKPYLPENSDAKRVLKWYLQKIIKNDDGTIVPAEELVNISHAKGSPWHQLYIEGQMHIEIDDDRVKNYFKWYRDWLGDNSDIKY